MLLGVPVPCWRRIRLDLWTVVVGSWGEIMRPLLVVTMIRGNVKYLTSLNDRQVDLYLYPQIHSLLILWPRLRNYDRHIKLGCRFIGPLLYSSAILQGSIIR